MFAQNRLNPRTQKDQSAHLGRAEIWINGVRLSDINFDLQRCEVTEDLEAIGMVTLRLYHEARLAALRRGELQYWSDDRRLDIGNSLEVRMGYETTNTVFVGEITGLELEFSKEEGSTLVVRGHENEG
jgi:hypothetical protein